MNLDPVVSKMTFNGGSAKKGGFFTTYTGIRFNPIEPEIDKICIQDISQALSHYCRFGGHVNQFYSVAQHCVHVSYLCNPEDALSGLLHDSSEAYMGDMVRPLKHSDSMKVYRDLEERLEEVIAQRFGIPHPMPASVKAADDYIVVAEAIKLFDPAPQWALDTLKARPHNFKLGKVWSPKRAKVEFMARYIELTQQRVDNYSGTGTIQ